MKKHENRPGTMKIMKTDLEPAKTNLEGISKNVTNKQTDRTFLLYIDFRRGVRLHIAFEDDIQ